MLQDVDWYLVRPVRHWLHRNPRGKRAAYTLAVVGLVLGGVELGMRGLVPVEYLLWEWERPDRLIAYGERGELITEPNMELIKNDGPYTWRVRLNAQGFREDAEVGPKRSTRILALGDSWMFGFSVDQDNTIPEVLEARLPGVWGREVDVVNAGVFGSSAFDVLVRYRQLVDVLEPDGILIGAPHNARVGSEVDREAWYRSVTEGPKSRVRLYLLMRRLLAWRTPQYAEAPTDRKADVADMQRLVRDARARGLAVWFIEFPNNMNQALDGGAPESWRQPMEAAGAWVGGHALRERACWGYVDVGHPSEAGARVIAQVMLGVIVGGKSLPLANAPGCGG